MTGRMLMVAALVAGCGRSPSEPTGVQLLALKPSEQVVMHQVVVTFLEVTSDSRCPSDAMCVWAGNAAVRIAYQAAGTKHMPQETTLNTTLDPRSVDFAGVRIQLDSLTPLPKAGKPIPPSDYVAWFSIFRISGP